MWRNGISENTFCSPPKIIKIKVSSFILILQHLFSKKISEKYVGQLKYIRNYYTIFVYLHFFR